MQLKYLIFFKKIILTRNGIRHIKNVLSFIKRFLIILFTIINIIVK